MKYLSLLFIACLLGFTLNDPFTDLTKLEGTWLINSNEGIIYQEWEKLSENEMQGRNYMISGSDTTTLEKVILRKTGDGIFYIAELDEQNNEQFITFKLANSTETVFIFENPRQELSRKLYYEFINQDSIYAYLEETAKGTTQKTEFNFSRNK